MGSRQIVLVSTAGISVHNAGIFWREAKTKRLFSQCKLIINYVEIIACQLELFKNPIIDLINYKRSAYSRKGEINNLTSAILSVT